MTKPVFILLCGPSGSGKSTLRKNILAGQYPELLPSDTARVISRDDVLEDYAAAHDLTYQEAYEQYADKGAEIIAARLTDAFDRCENVICDGTHLGTNDRRALMAKTPAGYLKIAAYLPVRPEEIRARVAKRNEETNKFIPGFVLDAQLAKFTLPRLHEGFDAIATIDEMGMLDIRARDWIQVLRQHLTDAETSEPF